VSRLVAERVPTMAAELRVRDSMLVSGEDMKRTRRRREAIKKMSGTLSRP
jgi:hypothetical protein